MGGIRSCMAGPILILSSAEDYPFATPNQQPVGKLSFNLPTNNWLCRKMDKLSSTLVQGYPYRRSQNGSLQRNQFVKLAKSQAKWDGLHP